MIPTNQYVQEVYAYLHTIPEKSHEEHLTSAFVAQELEKMHFQVISGVGGTGVLGILDSGLPGPVVACRADMDAVDYQIDGKVIALHTCGHDAHTAMLLSLAKRISERGLAEGKFIAVFQPAEESLTGARAMLDSGEILQLGIQELFGIHIRPIDDMQVGQAAKAIYNGAVAKISVTINGLSSHAARPHLGVNTVEAAVLAVNAINAIRMHPLIYHNCQVIKIDAGSGAVNLIPDHVDLLVEARSHDDSLLLELIEKIKTAVLHAVACIRATAEFKVLSNGVPAAKYENTELLDTIEETIVEVLGKEALQPPLYNPAVDDFHLMAQTLGCKAGYFALGAGATPGLHHPDMTLDRSALNSGSEILFRAVGKRIRYQEEEVK